jgi:hypothetical protein
MGPGEAPQRSWLPHTYVLLGIGLVAFLSVTGYLFWRAAAVSSPVETWVAFAAGLVTTAYVGIAAGIVLILPYSLLHNAIALGAKGRDHPGRCLVL